MKMKETYLTFDNNGKFERNFCTFGQAQCNPNGCVSLENLIMQLKDLVTKFNNLDLKEEELFKDFEKNKEELKMLENILDNTYTSYYNITHVILAREEIDIIQDKIGNNFISNQFIDDMIKYLESKEV